MVSLRKGRTTRTLEPKKASAEGRKEEGRKEEEGRRKKEGRKEF